MQFIHLYACPTYQTGTDLEEFAWTAINEMENADEHKLKL